MKQKRKPGPVRHEKPAFVKTSSVLLFGLHAVAAALNNPVRELKKLSTTDNALPRLLQMLNETCKSRVSGITPEKMSSKDLAKLSGDAVHQGVLAEFNYLPLHDVEECESFKLVIALDQVTDPHNVGAIMRSATALGADALLQTGRNSAIESGTLAKSASGGLDLLPIISVPNLAQALNELKDQGFHIVGFDSEESIPLGEILERAPPEQKLVLVMGSEGKGLRRLTRDRCDELACLDMPGPIKSLNVSNAAAIALQMVHLHRSK
ncbi:MAG: 23S rRNA (guanosine(2251)-2'-O)-methyltransferase RlmB [Cohaesibacteraceae bacterium]|nr:23S rRNA (guanosine(2251)-2'-O)-methyltransferase RlmB [Cohaesibacteraceae bacterium]